MADSLQVDVYVSPAIEAAFGDPDPALNVWSPISSTLIQGPKSAVIADTPINIEQSTALAEWIKKTAPGKVLTHIFVTHAHLDHFAGAPVLLEHFPGAKFVATQKVANAIATEEISASTIAFWSALFPNGQLAQQTAPEALPTPSNSFELDGHTLRAVDVEHSDTHATSYLHVPTLRLVVGGDIVYGDCHQFLRIANTAQKRQQWINALDEIAALDPTIVVPGHKRATQVDGPYLIEATKAYIRAFEEEISRSSDATELKAAMKKRYPTRWNEYILESGCVAAFQS